MNRTRTTVTFLLIAAGMAFLAPANADASDVVLPAGTLIPIRFETTVSSATSRREDKVIAAVRQDVRSFGRVVIPAGSEVKGHVVSVRRSGKVSGRAYLAVSFDQVEIHGRVHRIVTPRIARLAPKAARKDAAVIGGGAGAGALIGAIADGKEGAAKGALIGGAAGTGAVLSTRGPEVSFASGARYRLRLAEPLRLDE
jgi:hypothetical protein